jgi:hypothetical protein
LEQFIQLLTTVFGSDAAKIIAAFLGGGLALKIFEVVYEQLRAYRTRKRQAREVVEKHLDPVVKAADELVGKVRALAVRDFTEFGEHAAEGRFIENRSSSGLMYLLAAFWCRLELLRAESVYVELVRDKRGKTLRSFINCLESQKIRLVDRVTQRAVGELMIERREERTSVMPYVQVAQLHETDARFREWLNIPMKLLVAARRDRELRQRLLVYGTVVQAMVDTLDSKHVATKPRPAFANKLSMKSRRALKVRVFDVYLPDVGKPETYYQPPETKAPRRV